MAQPSFDSILNAVMQAESGGRRYDDRGNLLTSPKGAQGEMQVMPRTAKDPGFGVEPAKSSSPDELARVGRDYLKTMLDRYGSLDKALVAYNWGPKNADAWIAKGADPAKLPDETKKYVSRVQSTLSAQPRSTAQAQPTPEAAPAAAPARGAPAAAPVRVSEARPADLGASYQAALALSFLADEDEKESGRREYDERQPSAASQWLARETRKVSPESLALPFRSPFAEPEPVKAADGGFIAVGYEDGGEVDAVASKSTEQPSRPEPFRIPPGQTEARLREFNRLDPATRSLITRDDPRVEFALTPAPASVSAPYTLSTMPGARALYDQTLAGTTTGGYVHPALKMQSRSGKEVAPQDVVFLRPGRDQAQELQSRAHEAEHLLAKRGLGDATAINDKFDELMKDSRARRSFVEGAVGMQPYLEKTYGTKSTYFMPEMLAFQDKRGRGANLLYEQFAELAAIEQATGKDLTKDPELRKTIFKDKKVREVYNSMTGLRQTRLDARDLAPYTPISEKPEGMMEFIRSKLGFAEGGEVDKATARGMLESLKSGEGAQAFLRGLTMLPQNIVGAPVDVVTMALRPFGYSVEKPVGGSDWLKEKSRQAGVAFAEPTDANARALYTAGDIASNLINPAGATRAAVRGVKEVGEQAGQAAKMLRELKPPSGPDLAPAGVPAEALRKAPEKSLEELVSAPMKVEGSNRDFWRLEEAARAEVREGKPVTAIPKERMMQFTQPVMPVGKDMQWVRLTDPRATILEGGAMNHSIGEYSKNRDYGLGGLPAFLKGNAEVYSLRDRNGFPVVTMEVEKYKNGERRIHQIKGPSNSDPSFYRREIFEFMDNPDLKVVYANSDTYRTNRTGKDLADEVGIFWNSEFQDWKQGMLDRARQTD